MSDKQTSEYLQALRNLKAARNRASGLADLLANVAAVMKDPHNAKVRAVSGGGQEIAGVDLGGWPTAGDIVKTVAALQEALAYARDKRDGLSDEEKGFFVRLE